MLVAPPAIDIGASPAVVWGCNMAVVAVPWPPPLGSYPLNGSTDGAPVDVYYCPFSVGHFRGARRRRFGSM